MTEYRENGPQETAAAQHDFGDRAGSVPRGLDRRREPHEAADKRQTDPGGARQNWAEGSVTHESQVLGFGGDQRLLVGFGVDLDRGSDWIPITPSAITVRTLPGISS